MDLLIKTKRVYDPPSSDDGARILVDRLWPRGMSKEKAKLHLWLKDVAPSDGLRTWYGHEPQKWQEFQERYRKELQGKQDLLARIKRIEKEKGTVTLVYSSRETEINNAIALKLTLEKQ